MKIQRKCVQEMVRASIVLINEQLIYRLPGILQTVVFDKGFTSFLLLK